jgi:hypothetical protein
MGLTFEPPTVDILSLTDRSYEPKFSSGRTTALLRQSPRFLRSSEQACSYGSFMRTPSFMAGSSRSVPSAITLPTNAYRARSVMVSQCGVITFVLVVRRYLARSNGVLLNLLYDVIDVRSLDCRSEEPSYHRTR